MMKKLILGALTAICGATAAAALTGCGETLLYPASVLNGGFESGNLSGWTVEYGDAYDDDSVSSRKTFSYSAEDDPHGYLIPVNQTGNWYLSGKGFDNKRSPVCTGAIRSNEFVLGGDGVITMKLAGGAQATSRQATALKPAAQVCYVGVYRSSDDKMIACQTNDYFAEDAENIKLEDYTNGTCYTDNFYTYKIDLGDYIGETLYLRIVDNDTSYYYGYLSVDDIRIGENAEPQPEGAYFAKSAPVKEAVKKSEYDIKNGDFETGNLSGWTIYKVSDLDKAFVGGTGDGRAFSDDGVNADPCWREQRKTDWPVEQIPYERQGNYHYGYYEPTATGVMRSDTFKVGGSGYISYMLGGCSDNGLCYLRIIDAATGNPVVDKISNFGYKNFQYPYVQNGLRTLNLNRYKLDLAALAGQSVFEKSLYIEVWDKNASASPSGCVVLDDIVTYYEKEPEFTDCFDANAYIASLEENIPDNATYQVKNGGFESGNLDGWTMTGAIGDVISDDTWWVEKYPFNKSGKFLFSGLVGDGTQDNLYEGNTGTLESSLFTVGGTGRITFKFGGGLDPNLIYISIVKESGEEVARYCNHMFLNRLNDNLPVNRGTNLLNMVTYRADLSAFMGERVKIVITDNSMGNWGLFTCDSFVTYYEKNDVSRFPANSIEAIDILHRSNPPEVNIGGRDYQVKNGGFETGNLDGWTRDGGNTGNVSFEYIWWNEWYTYNKKGLFFYNGREVEGERGTLTSSAFYVGGCGFITYRFGGGKNKELCYIEIIDANDPDKVYLRFGNDRFTATGGVFTGYPLDKSCIGFGCNMVLYKADLSKISADTPVRIRIVDNATGDWGLITADDFVTYYENEASLPAGAVTASNLLQPAAASETAARVAAVANEAMIGENEKLRV